MNKIKLCIGIMSIILVMIMLQVIVKDDIHIHGPTGYITGKPEFNWSYNEKANYTLLIDETKAFASPIIIKTIYKSYVLNLKPGKYYWKVIACNKQCKESKTRHFTIDSGVVVKKEQNNTLRNVGNIVLEVKMNNSNLSLDINETTLVKGNEVEVAQK